MNSLQKFSDAGRKALIAITIISTLTLAAVGQRVQPQQQGKMYGEPGFVGEPINLKVVNADIRDILNYITEQYGINFVIDSSVKSVPVTVNVSDVPWNVALDSVLRAQGLGIQVSGNILRVADAKVLAAEYTIIKNLSTAVQFKRQSEGLKSMSSAADDYAGWASVPWRESSCSF